MKRNCLISTFVVIGCILLLQLGCQEEEKVTTSPETNLTGPGEQVILPPHIPEKNQPQEQTTTPGERTTRPKDQGEQVILPQPGPDKDRPPEETTTPNEPQRTGPKLTFENTVHDFGEIGPGTKNTCEFKFKNTGDALLKITKIQSTCGCTVPKLAKKEYAPGESGAINVVYNAARAGGKVGKTLYVSSNDKEDPRIAVHIKGTIVTKVRYSPTRLRLLLKGENGQAGPITLTSADNRPFSIKSVTATGNWITVAFDPSEEKTSFVLKPQVDVGKLEKHMNGSVRIGLSHPKCRSISIPYNVLSRFEVKPRSIMVGDAKPEEPIIRKGIWVLNNYNEDFEIEKTSSQNGIVRLLKQERVEENNGYKLELEITPPAVENKRVFSDAFYVHIKGGEKLRINCRGYYSRK